MVRHITTRTIATLSAAALLSLGTTAAPADAAPLPPCATVSDVDCTMTVTQVSTGADGRPGPGGSLLRSVNGGPFEPFIPENVLYATIAECQSTAATLESGLLAERAHVASAEAKVARQAATIKRLRQRLHAGR